LPKGQRVRPFIPRVETHRIDDLVVDESNTPIGVVDSQDLARFKLI